MRPPVPGVNALRNALNRETAARANDPSEKFRTIKAERPRFRDLPKVPPRRVRESSGGIAAPRQPRRIDCRPRRPRPLSPCLVATRPPRLMDFVLPLGIPIRRMAGGTVLRDNAPLQVPFVTASSALGVKHPNQNCLFGYHGSSVMETRPSCRGKNDMLAEKLLTMSHNIDYVMQSLWHNILARFVLCRRKPHRPTRHCLRRTNARP